LRRPHRSHGGAGSCDSRAARKRPTFFFRERVAAGLQEKNPRIAQTPSHSELVPRNVGARIREVRWVGGGGAVEAKQLDAVGLCAAMASARRGNRGRPVSFFGVDIGGNLVTLSFRSRRAFFPTRSIRGGMRDADLRRTEDCVPARQVARWGGEGDRDDRPGRPGPSQCRTGDRRQTLGGPRGGPGRTPVARGREFFIFDGMKRSLFRPRRAPRRRERVRARLQLSGGRHTRAREGPR
jgi:hypothetical protein